MTATTITTSALLRIDPPSTLKGWTYTGPTCPTGPTRNALHFLAMRIILPVIICAIAGGAPSTVAQREAPPDPVKTLVDRLELEKYKATIKGLTQFGDRRQGTDRNRAAVDWIEAQLKSYGCANTERITYNYTSPPPRAGGRGGQRAASANATGGGRIRR